MLIQINTAITEAVKKAAKETEHEKNNKIRSRKFIEILHYNFRNVVFPLEQVFSKEVINETFNRREYLYDMLVCKKGNTKSGHNSKISIPYIKEAILVLESEFRENLQYSIDDFNKLVCAKSTYYVMILPLSSNHKIHYLDPIKQIAKSIKRELLICFIDPPKKWHNDKINIVSYVYDSEKAEFKPFKS